MAILRMWSSQKSSTFSDLAKDNRSLRLACLDIQLFAESGQHLNALFSQSLSVNENSTAIIIALEMLRYRPTKCILVNLQLNSFRPCLTLIHEARKSQPSTSARIKAQFSITNDFHSLLADFELAFAGSVVASCTKTEISASHLDVLLDTSVAIAVQDSAVSCICTAWEDKQCTCSWPGFVE